jgi:hypothetical protein
MGYEYRIRFTNIGWQQHSTGIEQRIMDLPTFCAQQDGIFEFLGMEGRSEPKRWSFDVRLIREDEGYLMEMYLHPPSIERDIKALLGWLREQPVVTVEDDDGLAADW